MDPNAPVAALVSKLVNDGVVNKAHEANLLGLFRSKGKVRIGDLQSQTDRDWSSFNLPPGLINLIRSTIGSFIIFYGFLPVRFFSFLCLFESIDSVIHMQEMEALHLRDLGDEEGEVALVLLVELQEE